MEIIILPTYSPMEMACARFLILEKVINIGFESNDYRKAIENGYNKNRIQDLNHLEMYKKDMITDYEIKEDILEKTIVEWKQKNKNPIDVLPQLTERDKSRLAFWSQYLVICCCYAEAKANRRDFLLEHGFIPKKQKNKILFMSNDIYCTDEICQSCTKSLLDEYFAESSKKIKSVSLENAHSITLKSICGALLNGSFVKSTFIDEINKQFYDLFISGKLKRLYEAHSTVGRMEDYHDMSSKRLNGLELKIKNDSGITINEVEEFAQTFLANDELVRQLLTIGYSTLIIKGTTNNIIQYYRLCDSFQS